MRLATAASVFVLIALLITKPWHAEAAPTSSPATTQASPAATVTMFFERLRAGDVDGAYQMMAPSRRHDIRNEVEKMSQGVRSGRFNPTVGDEQVRDDAALVVFHEHANGRARPFWVARVGGGWRILLEHPEDFQLSTEQLQRFKELEASFRESIKDH